MVEIVCVCVFDWVVCVCLCLCVFYWVVCVLAGRNQLCIHDGQEMLWWSGCGCACVCVNG